MDCMRVKAPKTIVTFPHDGNVIVYNYLNKQAITCPPQDVYWVVVANDWTDIDDIVSQHPGIDTSVLRQRFADLVAAGIVVGEGSELAATEARYMRDWELGIAAGMFHFTLLDTEYGTPDDTRAKQEAKAAIEPSPDLYWRNSEAAIALPTSDTQGKLPVTAAMRLRRSNRNIAPEPITLADLGDCLAAGLGITGFVKAQIGHLPLKMAPSGGARNPYEAFVFARNVEGLDPGTYHYSAVQHSLEKVQGDQAITGSAMLAGQDWGDTMAAVIFLVAVLKRTTWKYNDPNAYRVVIIEAGHIAQNILLAATDKGLASCPTGALSHSKIAATLALRDITHTPVYAVGLGTPLENTDEIMSTDDYQKFIASRAISNSLH
jgi:SagB-type dehydrogenase family enzyme